MMMGHSKKGSETESPSQRNSVAGGPSKCSHLKKSIKIPKLKKSAHGLISKSHTCHTCQKGKDKKDESRASTPIVPSKEQTIVDMEKDVSTRTNSIADSLQNSTSSQTNSDSRKENTRNENSNPRDNGLYVCLRCAVVFCHSDNDEKNHIKEHADQKDHVVTMRLDTLEIWCFECNTAVQYGPNINQVAFEAVKLFEKWRLSAQKTHSSIETGDMNSRERPSVSASKTNRRTSRKSTKYPGLANLGNTCFFNSCLQALSYTKLLQSALNTSSASNHESVGLKPLTYLDNSPLTQGLKDFLTNIRREILSPQASTVSPDKLHKVISQKWSEYRHYDEQDAHELLRRLLDAVREEQLTRGENGKVINYREETVIDSIFGGKLVSIIVCDQCKHISYTLEDCMDLSIPIAKETTEKRNTIKSFFANMMRPSRSRTPSPSMTRSLSSSSNGQIPPRATLASPDLPTPLQSQQSAGVSGGDSVTESDTDEPTRRSRVSSFSRGLEFLRLGYSPSRRKTLNDSNSSIPLSPSLTDVANENSSVKQSESVSESSMNTVRLATPPPPIMTVNSAIVHPSPTLSVSCPSPMTPSSATVVGPDEARLRHAESLLRDLDLSESANMDSSRSRSVGVSVSKCFSEFMAVDVLSGENALSCDKCYEAKYGVPPPSTPKKTAPVFFPSQTTKVGDDMDEELHRSGNSQYSASEPSSESHDNIDVPATQDAPILNEKEKVTSEPSCITSVSTNVAESETYSHDRLSSQTQDTPKEYPRVLSRALKRYLIFSAPRVLVVHLKRFEQIGMGMKKCQTHVQFDEVLDLEPYMAPKNVQLNQKGIAVMMNSGLAALGRSATLDIPLFSIDEANTPASEGAPTQESSSSENAAPNDVAIDRIHGGLYKLYAIVSHQGNINGGHYVAYVRVQRDWVSSLGGPSSSPRTDTASSGSDQNEWIYCSDSEVRHTSWEEVSKVQAYILFYERSSS